MSNTQPTLQDLVQKILGADEALLNELLPQIQSGISALQADLGNAEKLATDARAANVELTKQVEDLTNQVKDQDTELKAQGGQIIALQSENNQLKEAAALSAAGVKAEAGEPTLVFDILVDGEPRRYAPRYAAINVPGYGTVSAADICSSEELQLAVLALDTADALLSSVAVLS